MAYMATQDRIITAADLDAAKRLREIWEREQAARPGLTQESAALDMKMTQGAVSQFLLGKVALGVGATLKFAKLLAVSPLQIRPDLTELLKREAAGTPDLLSDIVSIFPKAFAREMIDYLLFKVDRAPENLFVGEKAAHYTAMIERIKADLKRMRDDDDDDDDEGDTTP
jgi:transcriptional regulator with XRE-family HTH domain